MGDFNALASASERIGGSSSTTGISHLFVYWLQGTWMIDLGYVGLDFTWKRGTLHERMDRVVAIAYWRVSFPEAVVTHLVRYQSDHMPLLLNLDSISPNQVDRPFRFLQAWVSHTDYMPFVEKNWNCDGNFMDAITQFTSKLRDWNHSLFGDIFRKKNTLLARLNGIQRVSVHRPSRRLQRLESELKEELDSVLLEEELLWFQKSRSEWIQWGERNTSFFHLRSVRRRKRNRIEYLQAEDGSWIEDQDILQRTAIEFFSSLYTEDVTNRTSYHLRDCFPTLSETESQAIRAPFTATEIRQDLFSMKPWKAPGFDGIQAGFYQMHWNLVGKDLCNEVLRVLGAAVWMSR